jgi:hypothetical protein
LSIVQGPFSVAPSQTLLSAPPTIRDCFHHRVRRRGCTSLNGTLWRCVCFSCRAARVRKAAAAALEGFGKEEGDKPKTERQKKKALFGRQRQRKRLLSKRRKTDEAGDGGEPTTDGKPKPDTPKRETAKGESDKALTPAAKPAAKGASDKAPTPAKSAAKASSKSPKPATTPKSSSKATPSSAAKAARPASVKRKAPAK